MSETPKKELSMEMRLLLAFLLMGAVLFLTPYFYKPQPQPKPAKPVEPPVAQQVTRPPAPEPQPVELPSAPEVAARADETAEIDTQLYRIRFSNRGAVVLSWILKKYVDSSGQPLELVNPAAVAKVGYPFALEFKNDKPATDLNQALYAVHRAQDGLGIDFEFSDGTALSRKSFRFLANSYLAQIQSEVGHQGVALPHLLSWRGGFGDSSVEDAATWGHSLYFDLAQGKLIVNDAKAAKNGPVSASGSFSFAGVEDKFFAAVFLPGGASTEIVTFSDTIPPRAAGAKEAPHAGAAIGGSGRNRFALFVGPKDMDILRKVDPKLDNLVDFGWFAFLAKPLFYALNWTNDHLVRNYGWSIVLVTVVINLLLWPLRFSQMKSMKKMQWLQPQVAAINAKYKDVGLRDPRKAQQNQEVMELYKKHGVNPMGGCMPLLLQMPFFFAFYKVLTVSIEMRGARWLWVTDLSIPETLPIHILPLVMVATQFVQQKMTPSTTADPTQQRVMLLMPLMLGFMFYSVSSGLVLYWLTGNVVGIAQQWVMNRMSHAPAPPPAAPAKPAPKKKTSRN